ncbi:MAG: hypothetical protein WBE98_16515 [Gammaproteobacteria bacterium]
MGKRLLYRVSRSRAARNGYPVLIYDDSRPFDRRLTAGLRLHRENASASDDDMIDVESVALYVVKDVPPARSEILQMIGNYPLPQDQALHARHEREDWRLLLRNIRR